MRISGVRIRNYRTIRNEIAFDLPNLLSIVGPNNAGKSNIARALEIFFSGRTHNKYDPKTDMPFGIQKEKTSITVSFKVDGAEPWDSTFIDLHDQLRNLHPDPPSKDAIVSLNLYFNDKKPVYQFFGNVKRPTDGAKNAQYSRVQNDLLDMIFEYFKVYYVPSAKSFSEIFSDFIFPELKADINPTVVSVIPQVNKILSSTSNEINQFLSSAGLQDITTSISISESSVDSLVSKIDFMIADNISTELSRKGTGIQATAIFAALRWIDERKRSAGHEVLWIVEEPESYLHPELTRTVNHLISTLSDRSTVMLTTHSLAFVPKTVENVIGCEKISGNTTLTRFANFNEATYRIKKSIGVRFSDYFNLAGVNVAVEGKSDRSIFESVLKAALKKGFVEASSVSKVAAAKFITFSGVRDLAEFVRVTYEFVSKECVFVTVFDGDEAGVKHRKDLQGYLSNRKPPVPFQSNRDFVSVRSNFSIEGLFPDWIIKEAYKSFPASFKSYSEDASGVVEPFQINDMQKSKIQDFMLDKLLSSDDKSDYQRFLAALTAIDGSIQALLSESSGTIFD